MEPDNTKTCEFCERKIADGDFAEHEQLCKRLRDTYRSVLARTPEAKLVLVDMLSDLGFFNERPSASSEQIALANYGKKLLRKCGVWNKKNRLNIVRALFGPEKIQADMV